MLTYVRTFVVALFYSLTILSIATAQLTVTDGLSLWLDAADEATLFVDEEMNSVAGIGEEVIVWADKSGNEYHAFADFDGPVLEDDAVGGQNGLAFSGGAQGPGMLFDAALDVARPYSIFMAHQSFSPGRTLQSATTNWLHGSWSVSFSNFAGGFVGSVPVEFERPVVTDATGTPDGDSTFFINNFDATNDASPTGSPGRLALGSSGQFAVEAANALVSEVLIYDRVLSSDELTSVRSYLYGKYNTSDFVPDLGAEKNTVLSGTLGMFTGGDEGDGLDLTGDFAYALNIGGFEAVVGDVEFAEATIDGGDPERVVITNATNELPAWFQANFGESDNDLDLAVVAGSIRFGGDLSVDLDVEQGQTYKLQLLFTEACCDRGFDVFVEDELVVDNLHLPDLQNGIENGGTTGGFYSGTFTAGDGVLNILLGDANPRAADNLPTLAAVTLERIENLLIGDFNSNGVLDIEDVNLLTVESASGNNDVAFDLDGDGAVTSKDVGVWVKDLKNTWLGDSNLDGEFNSTDFVVIFSGAKYEQDVDADWSEGDWNGDGRFSSTDLVFAFSDSGYERGPREPAAVPEPSTCAMLLIGVVAFASATRRRPT